jgi:hypothetical protein
MKATVVEIQSKMYRCDGKPKPYRLIALQFNLGLVFGGTEILRLPEDILGIVGLALDDEVEVTFDIKRVELFAADLRESEQKA